MTSPRRAVVACQIRARSVSSDSMEVACRAVVTAQNARHSRQPCGSTKSVAMRRVSSSARRENETNHKLSEDQCSVDTASVGSSDDHDAPLGSFCSSPEICDDGDNTSVCDACKFCGDCCGNTDCKVCCLTARPNRICSSACGTQNRARGFTMCQVRRHNHAGSAWLVAGDTIYDATPYVSSHPGGVESILKKAGGAQDCSRDLQFHSAFGKHMFKKYEIGKLRPCKFSGDTRQWWSLW